jgi:hypothetical protein
VDDESAVGRAQQHADREGPTALLGDPTGRVDRVLLRLALQPGGYHVMLGDLKRPLQAGDSFPLTLVFEKAGSIEVNVVVESMSAGAMHPHTGR